MKRSGSRTKNIKVIIPCMVYIIFILIGISGCNGSGSDDNVGYSVPTQTYVEEKDETEYNQPINEQSTETPSDYQAEDDDITGVDTYSDTLVEDDTENITEGYSGPAFLGIQSFEYSNVNLAIFGVYDSNGSMIQMLQICFPDNLVVGQVYDATSNDLNISFSDFVSGMTYSTAGSNYQGEDYFGIASQNEGNTGQLIIDAAQGTILRGRILATFVNPAPGLFIDETEILIDTSVMYEQPKVEITQEDNNYFNDDLFEGYNDIPMYDDNSNPHNQTGRTESQCPICHGLGYEICSFCDGSGYRYDAVKEYDTICPSCAGTGNNPCVYCGGTGIILN